MAELITCTPKSLPADRQADAARRAIAVNPQNRAPAERAASRFSGEAPLGAFLAIMTGKRWSPAGVELTVGFLETTPADLRARIVQHMNAWSRTANVRFVETAGDDAYVRVSRAYAGYWSWIGTDILEIEADQPTMNLQGFTMAMPDGEFRRVVRHEAGHALGFPHEHLRQDLVALIDPDKAIAYYGRTQGWTVEQVRQQVLTPIEQDSILGTPSDANSIMCYQIPGAVTRSGRPIPGGRDIDPTDYAFAARCYPRPRAPRPPVPPSVS